MVCDDKKALAGVFQVVRWDQEQKEFPWDIQGVETGVRLKQDV